MKSRRPGSEYSTAAGRDVPLEIEKTWILREKDHRKLNEYLRSTCPCKETFQHNLYLSDQCGVLSRNRASLRLRTEHLGGGLDRVLLTFKTKSSRSAMGAEVREEHEWDLTDDVSKRALQANASPGARSVPDRYREIVWQKYRESFVAEGLRSFHELELLELGSMKNRRLAADTECGLTLELDDFATAATSSANVYYQLEIETTLAQEEKRDRFVAELFRELGIPIVSHSNYPSKAVLTLVDAGVLQDRREWMEAKREVEDRLRRCD